MQSYTKNYWIFRFIMFLLVFTTIFAFLPIIFVESEDSEDIIYPGPTDISLQLSETYYILKANGLSLKNNWRVYISDDGQDYHMELHQNLLHLEQIGTTNNKNYNFSFNYNYSSEWGLCEYRECFLINNGTTIYDKINSSFFYSKSDSSIKVMEDGIEVAYLNSLFRIFTNELEINQTLSIYDFLFDPLPECMVFTVINKVPESWNYLGRYELFWEEIENNQTKNITLVYSLDGYIQSRLLQWSNNNTNEDEYFGSQVYYYHYLELPGSEILSGSGDLVIDGFSETYIILSLFIGLTTIYLKIRKKLNKFNDKRE